MLDKGILAWWSESEQRLYVAGHGNVTIMDYVTVDVADPGTQLPEDVVECFKDDRSDWEPTRWWRVMDTSIEGGWRKQLWCESSDEEENRREMRSCSGKPVLQRLYGAPERREWRTVE